MKLGILMIGSLIWSPHPVRCRWRQDRLSCDEKRVVKVPIRYGRKPKPTSTYSMVFARSCSEAARLGTGLVVPVRAECRDPQHLIGEAEHLWAAEKNSEQLSGICSEWGKVCVLRNPKGDAGQILEAWRTHIMTLDGKYTALPAADAEDSLLDPTTGLALFDWPEDRATNQGLLGFDLLLMTANKPTLNASRQYATADQIASAWWADTVNNGRYFYNNLHHGITTFQDDAIQAILRGDPPNPALHPTGAADS